MIKRIKQVISDFHGEKEWFIICLKTGGWQIKHQTVEYITTDLFKFEIHPTDNFYEVYVLKVGTEHMGEARIREETDLWKIKTLLDNMKSWTNDGIQLDYLDD